MPLRELRERSRLPHARGNGTCTNAHTMNFRARTYSLLLWPPLPCHSGPNVVPPSSLHSSCLQVPAGPGQSLLDVARQQVLLPRHLSLLSTFATNCPGLRDQKERHKRTVKYYRGKILERDKFDVDKFGSPTSYQIFPSILRMRCVKMCAPHMGCRRGGFSARCMQCECDHLEAIRKYQQPSRGHQEITAAIHYEATARDLIPKFSFISKDQLQIPPPPILALPKNKTPSNYSPGEVSKLGGTKW